MGSDFDWHCSIDLSTVHTGINVNKCSRHLNTLPMATLWPPHRTQIKNSDIKNFSVGTLWVQELVQL
jgi:hypothetical protein